jgi:hypothetical protein
MLIKVIKTVVASKNKSGTECLNYQVGEVYDIYEELAQVFIKENWGIEANNNLEEQQEKALDNLENKAIEIEANNNLEEQQEKALDNLENKAIKSIKKKEVNKNAE